MVLKHRVSIWFDKHLDLKDKKRQEWKTEN